MSFTATGTTWRVGRPVALLAYGYDRVRQVATSSNLKPGVILRTAIKLGRVQLEKRARPEGNQRVDASPEGYRSRWYASELVVPWSTRSWSESGCRLGG